jgi:CBS domain containing-hemolysin-like protein
MDRGWVVNALWLTLATTLIVANGFFVAIEFALVKVRPARLVTLARHGQPLAAPAAWLAKRLDRSLSACQLGITMASLALGWVGEPAIATLLEPWLARAGVTSPAVLHGVAFGFAFTIITAGHLVLGEQAPKIFAIRKPEKTALVLGAPMKAFYAVFYPLLRALDWATKWVLRAAGTEATGEHHETPHSPEELQALVERSRAHGVLSRWEHHLAGAALRFDDRVCRQVMVPRADVAFLEVSATSAEVLSTARTTKHTRYPVCRTSLDDVVGIVHIKDLVGIGPEGRIDLESLARPPKFVPETVRVSRLLGHFQATHQHLAIVVDEYGAVAGIVTMENVLEEIVGSVQDEFDMEEPEIVPDGPGRYRVLGSCPIDVISERLDLEIHGRDVNTLAGWISQRLERIPEQGDRIDLSGVSIEVLEVARKRAQTLLVVLADDGRLNPESEGGDGEHG